MTLDDILQSIGRTAYGIEKSLGLDRPLIQLGGAMSPDRIVQFGGGEGGETVATTPPAPKGGTMPFHRSDTGQTLISALVGALGGKIVGNFFLTRRQQGLAIAAGAGVGAFVLKSQIMGLLEQVGAMKLLDGVFKA